MKESENIDENDYTNSIILVLIESFISDGKIDPKGKDIGSLKSEAINIWKLIKPELKIADDNMEDMLNKAKNERQLGNLYFAVLFCALWFEHWINFIIYKRLRKLELNEQDILNVLRETSTRAKISWLLKLMQLPPLSDLQIKYINRVLELRNSFVHYKWNTCLLEEDGTSQKYTEVIDDFISITDDLKKYEIQNIFDGFESRQHS